MHVRCLLTETCKACVPDTDSSWMAEISLAVRRSDRVGKRYIRMHTERLAVQFGFCIPGMVMCTKALLDE